MKISITGLFNCQMIGKARSRREVPSMIASAEPVDKFHFRFIGIFNCDRASTTWSSEVVMSRLLNIGEVCNWFEFKAEFNYFT